MDVLGKWQKTSIHNRIAGDSWGTISWNDGKGFFVDIWLDCFYLSDDLIAPGVLLKYWLYIKTCWPLYEHVFIIIWIERSWWILGLNRGSNMWLKASIFGLGKGLDQRYPVTPFNGWVLKLQPRVLLQCCVLETLFLGRDGKCIPGFPAGHVGRTIPMGRCSACVGIDYGLGMRASLIIQSFKQAGRRSKTKALLCLKWGNFPACREEKRLKCSTVDVPLPPASLYFPSFPRPTSCSFHLHTQVCRVLPPCCKWVLHHPVLHLASHWAVQPPGQARHGQTHPRRGHSPLRNLKSSPERHARPSALLWTTHSGSVQIVPLLLLATSKKLNK